MAIAQRSTFKDIRSNKSSPPLLTIFVAYLNRSGKTGHSSTLAVMVKPASILLIEQNPIAARIIQRQIQRWGYHLFDQGEDMGDAILAIDREGPTPELAIVDLDRPISKEKLQQIRIFEFLYHVPILFICCASALEMKKLREQAKESFFLLKPYTTIQLGRALHQVKRSSTLTRSKYQQCLNCF